ncbi:vWA domain-containing protein [Steroidobacter sp.]|uniref:vWA domain-containing protein n=1 Tax=Steroidobacter sp. TaxID=1978227 RepID=UPI001A3B2E6D|nr:vWA domain-containing protein [Steroidobacter sp.]MBL8265245.1 VWA domain-containing protein [Steroidobacter sp.]
MNAALTFEQPWALILLPLALLPLLRRRRDTVAFPSVDWLPRDPVGRIVGWLWPLFAALAIASSVFALAQPGRPQSQVLRTGKGAEILVLLDRSRSMDDRMLPPNWRELDPTVVLYHLGKGRQKAEVARDLLSQFVARRPDDRFSLMYFSNRPLSVVPFTQHDAVMQAGIAAGGVGRGLADTEVGRALIAAIARFDQRTYSGSRIVMLVSDGGANLDDETMQRIRIGFKRNRIALYWIYLRSYNSAKLDTTESRWENAPEIALHRFFQTLPTPYRAYQAEDPESLSTAVADVERQQNLPLDFLEQIPRQDYSRAFLAVAAFSCAMLLLYRSLLVRSLP